ncbi:MAG: hypothetical protein U0790_11170 [Isosphaeraceae bacterium]
MCALDPFAAFRVGAMYARRVRYILTDDPGVPSVRHSERGDSVIGARLAGVVPEPQSMVLACMGLASVVLTLRFVRR